MLSQAGIKKQIQKLPGDPGVYIFKSKNQKSKGQGKILYIGKATNLKDRVRSYFNKDIVATRSPLVSKMLEQFSKIDFIKTDSVLEALVLEAHLIKKHQPEANIKEKDNRSFNYVVITKEAFPRVLIVRSRELFNKISPMSNIGEKISYTFGPFPNGSQLKEAMKIVRKMFPFRDKCLPAEVTIPFVKVRNSQRLSEGTPFLRSHGEAGCFNYQIGLCPGVCIGALTDGEYGKTITNIKMFFEGDKKKLIKSLEKQMKMYAKSRKFEKAQGIKKTIYTLNHIQDIALIKEDVSRTALGIEGFRIESYDIAHMSGQNVVGVMTVVEDGEVKKSDYRKFKIKGNLSLREGNAVQGGNNDTAGLKEVLERRLAHIEWKFPDLIVVDGGTAQKNIVEKVLKQNNHKIPVVSVVKDERHKPKEILGDKMWLKYEKEILLSNAEAHRYAISFHKVLRGKMFK